jgi:hypothetical protein
MLRWTTLTLLAAILPRAVLAIDISAATERALTKISTQYQNDRKPVMKKNIAVHEVRSPSAVFTAGGHTQTVRELIVSRLSQSLLFNAIERDRLDKILREHALQQTGATSSRDNVRIGELLNAHGILYATLSELGEEGVLSLQLIDVETGKIYAAEERFDKASLVAETERLADMAYLQKYGVGLSIVFLNTTFGGDSPGIGSGKTWLLRPIGVEARYRFSEYFTAGLALSMGLGNYKRFENYSYTYEPNNNSPPVFSNGTLSIESEGAPGFTLPVHAYLTYPFSRRFNAFMLLGMEPMLLTNVSTEMQPAGAIPFGRPVDERYRSYDERYKAESIAINVGLGAEYYVLPRFALSIRVYYSFNKMRINTQPDNIHVDMSGFSLAPAVTLYF